MPSRQTMKDGILWTYENGSTVLVRSDGSRQQWTPGSGTTVEIFTDGTQMHTFSDGGTMHIGVDGTRKQADTNGVVVITRPDGSTTTENLDGTRVTVRPDGTKVVVYPDENVTVTKRPDGSRTTDRPECVIHVDAQGKREVVWKEIGGGSGARARPAPPGRRRRDEDNGSGKRAAPVAGTSSSRAQVRARQAAARRTSQGAESGHAMPSAEPAPKSGGGAAALGASGAGDAHVEGRPRPPPRRMRSRASTQTSGRGGRAKPVLGVGVRVRWRGHQPALMARISGEDVGEAKGEPTGVVLAPAFCVNTSTSTGVSGVELSHKFDGAAWVVMFDSCSVLALPARDLEVDLSHQRKVGDAVKALWLEQSKQNRSSTSRGPKNSSGLTLMTFPGMGWYRAHISAVNPDGTYDAELDNGRQGGSSKATLSHLPPHHIRNLATPARLQRAIHGTSSWAV